MAAVMLGVVAFGPVPAAAKQKQDAGAPLPKNEIAAKVPSNYIALSRVHVPVQVNANSQYRALDLEVWLLPKDEENLALARTAKKKILEALRDDLASYNWEAFEDSDNGPVVAKQLVTATVEHTCGAKLDDVIIKALILK